MILFIENVVYLALNNYCTVCWWLSAPAFNKLRPRRNGCHFVDDIFKIISLGENSFFIQISEKYLPEGPINWQYISIGLDNDLPPKTTSHFQNQYTDIFMRHPAIYLTHRGLNKIFFRRHFSNAFSGRRIVEILLTFHWSLFPSRSN